MTSAADVVAAAAAVVVAASAAVVTVAAVINLDSHKSCFFLQLLFHVEIVCRRTCCMLPKISRNISATLSHTQRTHAYTYTHTHARAHTLSYWHLRLLTTYIFYTDTL